MSIQDTNIAASISEAIKDQVDSLGDINTGEAAALAGMGPSEGPKWVARLCQREGEERYALPGRRGLYVPRAVIELLLMFRMEAEAEMLRCPSGGSLAERVGRLIADHISPPAPGPDTRAVGLVALVTEIVRIEVRAALARERAAADAPAAKALRKQRGRG